MADAIEKIYCSDRGNGNNNAALGAIRTQMQDNHNDFALSQLAQNLNVDFNTLQKCCCDVQAANLGDCFIIEALNNCCCSTQRQIADFRADLLLQNCKDTADAIGKALSIDWEKSV